MYLKRVTSVIVVKARNLSIAFATVGLELSSTESYEEQTTNWLVNYATFVIEYRTKIEYIIALTFITRCFDCTNSFTFHIYLILRSNLDVAELVYPNVHRNLIAAENK
jgi:hypothetical protein